MASNKKYRPLKFTEDELKNLEDLIQSRKTVEFLKLFSELSLLNSDLYLFLLVIDGYRRLSLFQQGWKILRKRYQRTEETQNRGQLRLLSFWLSRWLHWMGATEFAAKMIEDLSAESQFELRCQAEILLTQFRFKEAQHLFEKYLKALEPLQKSTYESRFVTIEYADALAGEGYYHEAIATARIVIEKSPEPLLRGIATSCEIEYWARLGEYSKALVLVPSANKEFSGLDNTVDRLLLDKWSAYAVCRNDSKDIQKHYVQLLKAYKKMKSLGVRPEAWLDILRLLLLLKPNNKRQELIINYPGIDPNFLAQFQFTQNEILDNISALANTTATATATATTNTSATANATAGQKAASSKLASKVDSPKLVIRVNANEWWYNNRWSFGVPLELRCIALLSQAGAWGIYRLKLLSILWPDSHPATLSSLEKRLESLLRRIIQVYHLSVEIYKNYYFLPIEYRQGIRVEFAKVPTIFETIKEPNAEEFAKFYNLRLSQSYLLLKNIRRK